MKRQGKKTTEQTPAGVDMMMLAYSNGNGTTRRAVRKIFHRISILIDPKQIRFKI